ncbi:hypothetical protein CEUSTIGMA_g13034.t1 [Chlamydomonas eustigma]|uniref:Uncharacterized protein n=1 Tax=Chlamydomonas eustigma TaxID=1157962 RepID=A0A250XRQ0_9CHLO|nr:hypothetical protein CEUSTIGMA_g13034.t1 [Chlamydomonas eustigma]|eukprot:GAX85619.1 hypothetical protein CEUSTIGMA_g13034.t1 [Chlamydomonas eustigma]
MMSSSKRGNLQQQCSNDSILEALKEIGLARFQPGPHQGVWCCPCIQDVPDFLLECLMHCSLNPGCAWSYRKFTIIHNY